MPAPYVWITKRRSPAEMGVALPLETPTGMEVAPAVTELVPG
jgi:hypothetical protein